MNELVRFAMVAFFPRVDDLPGLADLDVDDKVAALRRDSTHLFWFGVVSAAVFFQLSPILTVRRPWPAVFLTPDELDAHAHRIASHPVYLIRQIVVLLKLTAGLFWGQSPQIRAFLSLPAYGPDPGTRRIEPHPRGAVAGPRAPADALVKLGERELSRGRGAEASHANADLHDTATANAEVA